MRSLDSAVDPGVVEAMLEGEQEIHHLVATNALGGSYTRDRARTVSMTVIDQPRFVDWFGEITSRGAVPIASPSMRDGWYLVDAKAGDAIRLRDGNGFNTASVIGRHGIPAIVGPCVTNDQLTMVIDSTRAGPPGLYISQRTSVTSAWPAVTPITEINNAGGGARPHLSDDMLTIYFQSSSDLWVAHRPSISQPFGAPMPLPGVNTAAFEQDPWVTPDQRHLMFGRDNGSGSQIYEAFR